MNQTSLKSEAPATRTPIFFRITFGLLTMLLLCGAAAALLLIHEADNINRAGGWGWLLVGGIYIAAATVVSFACAITTAVSLFRRETHRRVSIAILTGSCLLVWAFAPRLFHVIRDLRRQNEEAARLPMAPSQPPAESILRSPIPNSLVEHFRDHGLHLRPQGRYASRETEWILESASVGPRCEVVTSFVQFWSGASVESMRNQLMAVSTPSVINEHARMAMYYPHARGKTSDRSDCEEWSAKSKSIVEKLQAAFRSYQEPPAGDNLKRNR